ncbi:putative bifunctional diguanylate cyclase/phosphodiesterase [Paenibacillus sp.]|uniref:putative bifunctional diguanylate cyclase/phosphodiesterase n=1 Tax=Paenibacillus sp. TaxID=58172 RepID=UPI002D4510F6|nr:EAL domain-containing protein [Paenibacillus sp.]HZG56990.1 EAL domain-containing protein [Paenibacillus sp.]
MKQVQILYEASQVIFKHLGETLDANALFLAENDTRTNWIVSAWNRDEPLVNEGGALRFERTYCKIVCDRDGPVYIPDTAAEPTTMHLEVTDALGPRSFLGVPVYRRDGSRYGTICALDRPNRLEPSALRHVEQAALFLGTLIDLEDSAYTDELTGLYNRTYLEMFYEHLSADAPMSAVFIDIDRCKRVNETYGRAFGDAFLVRFAERLRQAARGVGIAARYAGDEFVVLLFRRSESHVSSFAASVYEQLTMPFDVSGHSMQVTVSMGISLEGATFADHMLHADAAMYQIKKNGKEGIAAYEVRFEGLISETGFRRGVKYNSFEVLYQPIVHTETAETAVEALIRLRHPEMGVVGPGAFLPHAIQSGYLVELDLQTLRNACRSLQGLRDWRRRVAKLAVNCDALALRRPDFPALVEGVLEATGFPAERLEFELNERISLYDVDAIAPQIGRLREQGVTFALDDFGYGYSTLGLLLKLPVQKVKLDRMFVEALPHDERSRAVVESLLEMCRKLRLAVVGEGVESDAQFQALRRLGCPWLQGYRLGRPVPIEDLEDTLNRAAAYSLRAGS